MVQVLGIEATLARIIAGRGVATEDAERFLEPKLRDLMPDPSVLTGMDAAIERLAVAFGRGERIAIFGDYDVDGACSAALLADYLAACGVTARIHIPDRITEGYGPNVPAIRALRGEGASLLVCVDCGTASHEPLGEAARIGLDVIVLDHHQAPALLPPAQAIVNPNRQDDLSGLGHLCAAGTVFLTLVALHRALRERGRAPAFDLLAALDLVALATVADVVPLTGLNRAFVRQGLTVIHRRARPGLTALLDVSGLNGPPSAWHLGFLVGPRINAGGRIGDAALGARLLTTTDPTQATSIAAQLDGLNRERQVIEQAAVAEGEAEAQALLAQEPDLPVLVVGSPGWHPGVVGLVAARLKEKFARPAFAFALDEAGEATGSGRSVVGVDLGRAVRAAVEAGAARSGGGHAMAAGVKVAAGGVAAFGQFLRMHCAEAFAGIESYPALSIDALLAPGAAQAELAHALEAAGPFGQGAPEPVFAFAALKVMDASVIGSAHVRARLKGADGATLEAIAFRCAEEPVGRALLAARGGVLHVAGSLAVDRWGGRERVQLRLRDVAQVGNNQVPVGTA